jgi:hypothetical protein
MTVRLDDETLVRLRERFVGCLCLVCLRSLGEPEVRTEAESRNPVAE